MLYEGPNKWKQKHRVPDTFYTNNDYANVIKLLQNLIQNRQKSQKM